MCFYPNAQNSTFLPLWTRKPWQNTTKLSGSHAYVNAENDFPSLFWRFSEIWDERLWFVWRVLSGWLLSWEKNYSFPRWGNFVDHTHPRQMISLFWINFLLRDIFFCTHVLICEYISVLKSSSFGTKQTRAKLKIFSVGQRKDKPESDFQWSSNREGQTRQPMLGGKLPLDLVFRCFTYMIWCSDKLCLTIPSILNCVTQN